MKISPDSDIDNVRRLNPSALAVDQAPPPVDRALLARIVSQPRDEVLQIRRAPSIIAGEFPLAPWRRSVRFSRFSRWSSLLGRALRLRTHRVGTL